MNYKYEDFLSSSEYIKKAIKCDSIDIAIILGSGLGAMAEKLEDKITIPYKNIPHFPVSTVSYQKGELIFSVIDGKKVLMMNGRFHFYEGYAMCQCAYPVGVFKLLGVRSLIVTNAAGGIDESYNAGDLVYVRDHIKFCAFSPVRGTNIPQLGERFFDMQSVYDKSLYELAKKSAADNGITLREGIYGYMTGPQFETPAEIRMLKNNGATLVGMSTVPEIIMAAQCSIPMLCISCVTNMAAGVVSGHLLDEQEVVDAGKAAAENLEKVVRGVVAGL